MVDSKTMDAWRKAPRLNSFATFFEQTASGVGGAPDLGRPEPEMDLLSFDLDCMTFCDTHRRLWGHFDSHYFASIPYRLEEECRLGAAILTFAEKTWARLGRPATVYTLGAGAGTLARALAKLGDGRVKTLNCSPTDGNRICFFARRGSEDAYFYHGPFFELDDERYEREETLQPFRDGYDVLLEDTTFQMYGRDRDKQIGFIAPRLRPNGVLVQVQKLRDRNGDAYFERERQKDEMFKSRFFSGRQILEKRRDVLDTMIDFQVDLETSRSALQSYFRYSVVTWNSGNFYTIVSSNSLNSLHDLVTSMVRPAIPSEFCYEQLPHILVNHEKNPMQAGWAWRSPQPIGGEV
ncbi:class I SAM-dependent methyltransferase [Rhizobium sp. P38BS-XIX]|uniref:class I SAM-dependent methyltransferase n=1 Tax=Rhizobium sp. P38BS-XIX TaxID=2726740 RepID=UPI00145735D3|nr:class I SAM-dependent methyltransferase [Rhizobium sp. P38BS-XIX]NLR97325.1 class I SAM-dependent methyltransferase [Rhizobium sp. P38BS-XIX]